MRENRDSRASREATQKERSADEDEATNRLLVEDRNSVLADRGRLEKERVAEALLEGTA